MELWSCDDCGMRVEGFVGLEVGFIVGLWKKMLGKLGL